MIPAAAPIDLVKWATAGVGSGPTMNTSIPIETKPLVRAVSSM